MGLIGNLFIIVINLAFVATDLLFLMIILKIIQDHWQIACLEPILAAIRPLMSAVLEGFAAMIYRMSGKSPPEKTLLALLIICLLVLRFLIPLI